MASLILRRRSITNLLRPCYYSSSSSSCSTPISASPAAAFSRSLSSILQARRFSSSEPDGCKTSGRGESISRPRAAFDPTRPRLSSSTRESEEWDWMSDPAEYRIIEELLESIYFKTSVIVTLSVAQVFAAACRYNLDPASPQTVKAASQACFWFGVAVVAAVGARRTLKFSNFGALKEPYILGAWLYFLDLLSIVYMIQYGLDLLRLLS